MLQELFSTVNFQFFNVLHFYYKSSPIFWLPAVFPLSCSPTWCWGGERTISPTTAFPSFQFRSHRLLWRYMSLSIPQCLCSPSCILVSCSPQLEVGGGKDKFPPPLLSFPANWWRYNMSALSICSSPHCLSSEKIFNKFLDKDYDQNHDLEIIVEDVKNGWKKG